MIIKKRILTLTLAVLLVSSMAVPALAAMDYTSIVDRNFDGFIYSTSDVCKHKYISCVIESGSAERTMRTDVAAHLITIMENQYDEFYPGTDSYLISSTHATTEDTYMGMRCYYYIGGQYATWQALGSG